MRKSVERCILRKQLWTNKSFVAHTRYLHYSHSLARSFGNKAPSTEYWKVRSPNRKTSLTTFDEKLFFSAFFFAPVFFFFSSAGWRRKTSSFEMLVDEKRSLIRTDAEKASRVGKREKSESLILHSSFFLDPNRTLFPLLRVVSPPNGRDWPDLAGKSAKKKGARRKEKGRINEAFFVHV